MPNVPIRPRRIVSARAPLAPSAAARRNRRGILNPAGERLALQDDLALFALDRFPYVPIDLFNNTGVELRVGDVVALSLNGIAAELDETWRSTRQFVVAMEPLAPGVTGRFCVQGYCNVRAAAIQRAGMCFVKDDALVIGAPLPTRRHCVVAIADGALTWADLKQGAYAPKASLGYFLTTGDSSDFSEKLVPAYWFGETSSYTDPICDTRVHCDFHTFNTAATAHNGLIIADGYVGTLTSGSSQADQAGEGIINVSGDGTNTGRFYFGLGTAGITVGLLANFTASEVIQRMRWVQRTATAATRWIGASLTFAGATPTNGIYFRHTAGGNIIAVSRVAGVETTIDTGIAAAVGTYHVGELRTRISGPYTYVFLDGIYYGKLLGAPAVPVGFGCHSSVVTANVGLSVDYLTLESVSTLRDL